MGGPGSGPRRREVSKSQGKRLLTNAGPKAARTIIANMEQTQDSKLAQQAAELIIAYDLGKPAQRVELDTPSKISVEVSKPGAEPEPATEAVGEALPPRQDEAEEGEL